MKFLFCKNCCDFIALTNEKRTCKCGQTAGKYLDDKRAIYSGEHAIPWGISNPSFDEAVYYQPEIGKGFLFTAFVMPKNCLTFEKVDEVK